MAELPPFACPACGTALTAPAEDLRRCPQDGRHFPRQGGIWRFLTPAQNEASAPFLAHYRAVRRAEGWGGETASYYRALPSVPPDDPHAAIWRVRAVSYRALVRRAVAPREGGGALRVLDLGAGNGWLAHRLARRGHTVAAVDLDDDRRDGLGAWVHYGTPPPFAAVQASFDRLPWVGGGFDLVIYNGALHYARDYRTTLAEALRVLAPDGELAIVDTPFYRRRASGEAMVRERSADFRARFGDPGAANEAFLTRERLAELGRELGLDWRLWRPFYGWRWHLRPLKNRLLGYREPVR
ncbi:MAG: class I SAM-dependent methyltransferase, partial [Acidobacteria bacterium]